MTDQKAYYLGLRDKPEVKKEEPVWINKDPVSAYKEEIEALKEALRKVLNNCGYAMHSDLEDEIEQRLK